MGLRKFVIPRSDYWLLASLFSLPPWVVPVLWKVVNDNLPNCDYLRVLIICHVNDMIGDCPACMKEDLLGYAKDADTKLETWVEILKEADPTWVDVVMEEDARVVRVLRCWKAALGDLLNKWFPESVPDNQRAMVLTDFQRARDHLRAAPDLSSQTWPNALHADRASIFQEKIESVVGAGAAAGAAAAAAVADAFAAAVGVPGAPQEVVAVGVTGAPQDVAAAASASAAAAAVSGPPQAVGIVTAV